MNKNKAFLEELKYVVENGFILNEYLIEQLERSLDKSPSLIIEVYQIFMENRWILPFVSDVEAMVYDYIVSREMDRAKTFYGATLFAADLFETTQTYIKCKVSSYHPSSYLKTSA